MDEQQTPTPEKEPQKGSVKVWQWIAAIVAMWGALGVIGKLFVSSNNDSMSNLKSQIVDCRQDSKTKDTLVKNLTIKNEFLIEYRRISDSVNGVQKEQIKTLLKAIKVGRKNF